MKHTSLSIKKQHKKKGLDKKIKSFYKNKQKEKKKKKTLKKKKKKPSSF